MFTPDVATQYEIPFKLSISTFHVSVMASTPAIASHKVRHPSLPSNFSVFMASRLAAVTPRGWGVRGHGARDEMQTSECGSEIRHASCHYAQVCVSQSRDAF